MSGRSATPEILDGENQDLMRRVYGFLNALLIVETPYCAARPFLLAGANVSGEIRIRQMSDLLTPVRRSYNQNAILQALEKGDFERAEIGANFLFH